MTTKIKDPVASIIKELMLTLVTGVEPVYINHHPDTPAELSCLYDTDGILEGRSHRSGLHQEKFGLQLKVRNPNFNKGFTRIHEYRDALLEQVERSSVTLGANTYTVQCVTATSPIQRLGREQPEDVNWLWTANFLVSLTLN